MGRFINFIDKFDSKNKRFESLGHCLSAMGIAVFIFITAMYCSAAIKQALVKDFWADEAFGLKCAVRSTSLEQLLILGAPGQASPAPLDYIFLKILDNVRISLHLEWVPYNVYYRLNSLFWTILAGVGVTSLYFCYFRSNIRNYFIFFLQIFFLAWALAYFYFRHDDLHFAIETRPYALWNSLWFSFMALFLFYREFNWLLLIISTALALTSSGSFFQLLVLALCSFAFQSYKTKEFLPAFKKTLLEFSFPLLISIYYSSKVGHWSYCFDGDSYHEYSKEFFGFWAHKCRVAIMAILGIVATCTYQKWQKCSVVFFTILLLYSLSPFCNYMILSKGMFFSSRQYLYYDLTFCILSLALALILPNYWERIKSHYKK